MTLTDELDQEAVEEQEGEGDARLIPRAASRSRRLPEAVPFALTKRDLALLHDVWRFRLLTTSQLETLRRADENQATRFVSRLTLTRRLKGLYHHRYLRRIARPSASGSQEPIYVLDREGARALSLEMEETEAGEVAEVRAPLPSRLPKAQGLEHLLLITQARVTFTAVGALQENGERLQLVEWMASDRVRFTVTMAGKQPKVGPRAGQSVTLLPDAGMVLRVRRGDRRARHMAFLEVDRGTEPLATLVAKTRAYFAYWQSGGFARDYAAPEGAGFWVLLTVPSKSRVVTLVRALKDVEGGLTMFRVALESDLVPARVAGAVWTEAGQGALVRPCQWTQEENR